MKELTKTQKAVLQAISNPDNDGCNGYYNYVTLGLSGRTQPAFFALAKIGLIERAPRGSSYRLVK